MGSATHLYSYVVSTIPQITRAELVEARPAFDKLRQRQAQAAAGSGIGVVILFFGDLL
jgi:hypothetical protein